MSSREKLLNVGPKSSAWLRQVGIRTPDELRAAGAVTAFVKVRRAGFKPSLNLLYALEGALSGVHWQQIPAERRSEMLLAVDAAEALLPKKGVRAAAVIDRPVNPDGSDAEASGSGEGEASFGFDDPASESDHGSGGGESD